MTEKFGFLRGTYLSRRRGRRGFLSYTALTDVLFLTAFYLYAHSQFVLQPGIHIQLPTASFTAGAGYHDMVVTLVDENIVFFNDERTTISGLADLFTTVAEKSPNTAILLEADGRVQNSTLVRIYNMAQQAGINEITLATGLMENPVESP